MLSTFLTGKGGKMDNQDDELIFKWNTRAGRFFLY